MIGIIVQSGINSDQKEGLKIATSDKNSPGLIDLLSNLRRDDQAPPVIAKLGWRYHHLGIPTDQVRENESYLASYKMYTSGFSTSPFGIEWMRFEPDSPLPEIIRTLPHVAFEVDDIDAAVAGCEVIFPPGSPSDGVRSAMILYDGAPVELIEFKTVV